MSHWTSLQLEQFKVFDKLSLPLAPLTMLTGFNASGKSSCIQALSLLHQSARENEWSPVLLLNGRTVSLGSAGDIINKRVGRRGFKIGLSNKEATAEWTFRAQRLDVAAELESFRAEVDASERSFDGSCNYRRMIPDELWESAPFRGAFADRLHELSYISAERIGPRETYAVSTPLQQHDVGPSGEFTVSFLRDRGEDPVSAQLLHKDEKNPLLVRQASTWLGHFFSGASFELNQVSNANLVSMSFRTSPGGEPHRPQNVGFGLTHILPVIVAGLGTKPGHVILLENPEAHLHPAGQAEIGVFLARVAASGVQVIFETHSDHVLNGVRRAVKTGMISPGKVATHFFCRDGKEDATTVQSVHMDDQGNLDDWPEGFFDQFDKDTSFFAGW